MKVAVLSHSAAHHVGKPQQLGRQSGVECGHRGSDIIVAQTHRVIINNRRSGRKLNI